MKIFFIEIKLCDHIVILLVLLMYSAHAQSKNSEFKNVEILKETEKEYSIEEVISGGRPFENYLSDDAPLKKVNYWLRFTFVKHEPSKNFYLMRPFLLNQRLDIYYKIRDSLYHSVSGVELPFEKRHLLLPNLYLPLPNTMEETVCYLHVKSFYGYSFFFADKDTESIISEEYSRASMEYFFIGLGFLSIIISIIFYIYLREKLYLYYSLFTLMLLMFRLTYSGILFNYIYGFYDLTNLDSIFNLYAISYAGINIALLLYFHEYFKFYERSKNYHRTIYTIIAYRTILLIANDYLPQHLNVYSDIAIQSFLLFLAIRTSKKYFNQSILTIISLAILIAGNILFMFPNLLFLSSDNSYYFYLNLASLEVMVFAIGMAHRNNFLKKQHDEAVAKTIDALKESELLKENINKELESQVAERTKQIQEMNKLLQLHNIKLSTEVKNANEARAFQKRMTFADFQQIFPDDEFCFQYLAKLKWKPNETLKCRKCGYEKHAILPNLSIRCGKCSYIESVTYGTLFQKLKFSILKAFYITYCTSTSQGSADATIAELAKEIELRPATLWAFKQKVLALMEENKTAKKHKDGWTHLIEHSITK